jgi:hypothetical protein
VTDIVAARDVGQRFLAAVAALIASRLWWSVNFGFRPSRTPRAADTEAICEAARRPSMRFVPVKVEEQQANGVVFRARDLLVHQRTQ